jgi:hypothetical protein
MSACVAPVHQRHLFVENYKQKFEATKYKMDAKSSSTKLHPKLITELIF